MGGYGSGQWRGAAYGTVEASRVVNIAALRAAGAFAADGPPDVRRGWCGPAEWVVEWDAGAGRPF
jgi:hypothetical protein